MTTGKGHLFFYIIPDIIICLIASNILYEKFWIIFLILSLMEFIHEIMVYATAAIRQIFSIGYPENELVNYIVHISIYVIIPDLIASYIVSKTLYIEFKEFFLFLFLAEVIHQVLIFAFGGLQNKIEQ